MTETLDVTIEKALTKIKSNSINDIRKYLPNETGGPLHHFSLKKMRKYAPDELKSLIGKYILDSKHPTPLKEKRNHSIADQVSNNPEFRMATKLLKIKEVSEDQELISYLRKKLPLDAIRKQLIHSLRSKKPLDNELLEIYHEKIKSE